MVTITKKEARKRKIQPEGKICEFHLEHPDQEAIIDSCPNCFNVEDPCGCNYESECEICNPIKLATIESCTHNLLCRHAIGRNGYDYHMKCIILKEMPNKLKILVFGDRNWKRGKDKKRIRYIDKYRLSLIKGEEND
jgi:hypothetical protein